MVCAMIMKRQPIFLYGSLGYAISDSDMDADITWTLRTVRLRYDGCARDLPGLERVLLVVGGARGGHPLELAA